MRGPPHVQRVDSFLDRITPAYAGTTMSTTPVTTERQDHPRLCGDHLPLKSITSLSKGSPPLMRGPLIMEEKTYNDMGITPAYAGTTGCYSSRNFSGRDHPRLCGDHVVHSFAFLHCGGSPPLMRGPPDKSPSPPTLYGITPAYAGTTIVAAIGKHSIWDHPRLCGDHKIPNLYGIHLIGSPPLMRGPPHA